MGSSLLIPIKAMSKADANWKKKGVEEQRSDGLRAMNALTVRAVHRYFFLEAGSRTGFHEKLSACFLPVQVLNR
jgi:hypothetical protein